MSKYSVSELDIAANKLPPDLANLYLSFKRDTQEFTLDMNEYANACNDAGVPVDFLIQEDAKLHKHIEKYAQPNSIDAPPSPTPTNRTQLENLIASTELAISYENNETMRQRLQKLIENTKLAISYL